jgi:hypothetical protein
VAGLTSLMASNAPMAPRLNERRARFVLTKIDQILVWEQEKERERDIHFVDLGRYLCEVRTGQYWRLENLASFDEFLAKLLVLSVASSGQGSSRATGTDVRRREALGTTFPANLIPGLAHQGVIRSYVRQSL